MLINTFLIFSLSGGAEKKSSNTGESYKLWSGEKPGNDVKVIHGKYWQSAHFTGEYTAYLELDASSKWKNEFIKQNHLLNTVFNQDTPAGAPNWFTPQKNSRMWRQQVDAGYMYMEDSKTGHFFIYEEQL